MLPLLISFDAIERDELNAALVAWQHKMGPLNRPTFRPGRAHGLRHHGNLVAVVATETLIADQSCGLARRDALELARVCAARPDLCRVVLRLWREFVFPDLARAWGTPWAISYQDRVAHIGDLYRFDGWRRIGFTSSGTDPRAIGGFRKGRRKTVWAWHADAAQLVGRAAEAEAIEAARVARARPKMAA